MTGTDQMGAVVIGRNEGQRLRASLTSVEQAGLPIVYVDSGSGDGSPSLARSLGVDVLELDPNRPFSAARARNEGLRLALQKRPATALILFLDGDCNLDGDFAAAAKRAFTLDPKLAVVTGHLVERHPEASIYNRLCAMEWRSAAGPIRPNGLGGIMVIQVAAFNAVGGFDEDAIAGEEPSLAVRLLGAGYSMTKIDRPMATHDAAMLTFRQWWIRAVRGGHALAYHFATHRQSGVDSVDREVRSALFWGFLLPLLVVVLLWPTRGLSLLLLGGYAYIGVRVARYFRARGETATDARWASLFNILSRFAHFVGMAKYARNRLRGSFQIIEYK